MAEAAAVPGVKVCVLWAGGWDEYLVDPEEVRDMTDIELAQDVTRVNEGAGCDPVIGVNEWLKVKMLSPSARSAIYATDTQVVKIIRHLDGGD